MNTTTDDSAFASQDDDGTEFNLVIDGVVALAAGVDTATFFDGLLDAIVEYVEMSRGRAGLSMSYHEYAGDAFYEEDDEPQDAADR